MRTHGQDMGLSGNSWLPVVVDLEAVPISLPTGGATHLFVTALLGKRPVGRVVLPAPLDPFPGDLLRDLIIQELSVEITVARFHTTPDLPPGHPGPDEVTVVVCTKDRPDDLRRCLLSLRALIGPRVHLIVVENGVSTQAVRDAAEEHQATYLTEPLPGLDRARNRGAEAAETEVVLFTDDDVEVDAGWAEVLAGCFVDPLVAAATGLVLPANLDSRARILSELYSSHGRGTRRRVIDGALISPAVAGSAGVGASMAFRRSFLRQIGGFPEELDAGMPTGTGGDTYALYRVLRAGRRIVYEPRALSYHWHRSSEDELHRAFEANGKGITAYIAHVVASDRDVSAMTASLPVAMAYLTKRVLAAMLDRPGSPPLRLAWSELGGAVKGLAGYAKARALVRQWGRAPRGAPGSIPWVEPFLEGPREVAVRKPSMTVIVPTRGRKASVVRLLGATQQQDYPSDKLEIVVVIDGDIDGTEAAIYSADLSRVTPKVLVLDGPAARGPAAARNAGAEAASGDLLVFFDDDVLPLHDGVLSAHAAKQRDGRAAVAGPCVVDLGSSRRFFDHRARNWWVDHVSRMNLSIDPHFTDLCTGNFSIPRRVFDEHGGFAGLRRREDWELSYRLGKAEVPLILAPEAGVAQVLETNVAESLLDRAGEGSGDVGFVQMHPEVMRWLPLGAWPEMRGRRRLVRILLNRPDWARPLLRMGVWAVQLLERAGARSSWSRWLDFLNFIAYWSGVGKAIGNEAAWLDLVDRSRSQFDEGPPAIDLANDDGEDLATGSTFDVLVTYRGQPLGLAPPLLGGLPWDRRRFVEAARTRFHDELVRAAVEEAR